MAFIHHGKPQDRGDGRQSGRGLALRNLCISVPALTLAFAVWMLWSMVVVHLPEAGFYFSTNQLFWLTALPAVSGATLRIFYALAVPIVGGRRFTALATASLLVPALGIGFAVQDPDTPYESMVALALLCGLGGANFASSMAHIDLLFSGKRKAHALGMNAGMGYLGVALVQGVVPVVVGIGVFGAFAGEPQTTAQGPMWLQSAGFVWVPFIAASALAAWFGMDDVAEAGARFPEQVMIITRKHNWLMCWLVLGSFGSFIGFAAALPLFMQTQFPRTAPLHLAGLGPLLGALLQPVGGWLADRHGGARTSFWSFIAMALGTAAVLVCLPQAGQGGSVVGPLTGSLAGLLVGLSVLFAASGLANGSAVHMIHRIFPSQRQHAAAPLPTAQAQATKQGQLEASAVFGLASAIGAYGGFFIPKGLGTSIAWTGSPAAALQGFIVFYLSCIVLVWWFYGRRHAPMPC